MLILKKTCLLAALMLAMCFGCEKPELDFDVAQLNGKCFRGKVLTIQNCMSFTNVQVLDADIGNKTVYLGREYQNVV